MSDMREVFDRLRTVEQEMAAHKAKCDERNKRVDKTLEATEKTLSEVSQHLNQAKGRKAGIAVWVIALTLLANVAIAVAHWVR